MYPLMAVVTLFAGVWGWRFYCKKRPDERWYKRHSVGFVIFFISLIMVGGIAVNDPSSANKQPQTSAPTQTADKPASAIPPPALPEARGLGKDTGINVSTQAWVNATNAYLQKVTVSGTLVQFNKPDCTTECWRYFKSGNNSWVISVREFKSGTIYELGMDGEVSGKDDAIRMAGRLIAALQALRVLGQIQIPERTLSEQILRLTGGAYNEKLGFKETLDLGALALTVEVVNPSHVKNLQFSVEHKPVAMH